MFVIIEPCSEGLNLISTAKHHGEHVAVVTANTDDRVPPAKMLALADRVVEVDTNDESALLTALEGLARESSLRAIVPGFEYYVPTAARLAQHFGLASMSPERAEAVRHKDLMRRVVSTAGLTSPRFTVVSDFTPAALRLAAEQVGFPGVAKVVDLAGGQGVRKINSFADLSAYAEGFLHSNLRDMGRRPSPYFLYEEYLPGAIGSVEGYIAGDKVYVVSVTEKQVSPEPWFVEVGHIVQADMPAADRQAVVEYATAVVRALGIFGVFHLEYRRNSKGAPVLVEVAARLAGGRIIDLIHRSVGIDLRDIMVRAYLGQSLPSPQMRSGHHAGVRFFLRPEVRQYHRLEGRTEVERLPGLLEMAVTAKPDQRLPPAENYAGRLGYVLFEGGSRNEVAHRLEQADRLLHFVAA